MNSAENFQEHQCLQLASAARQISTKDFAAIARLLTDAQAGVLRVSEVTVSAIRAKTKAAVRQARRLEPTLLWPHDDAMGDIFKEVQDDELAELNRLEKWKSSGTR